jgi:hypothetical protein
LFGVLSTIYFNYQLGLEASKIHDVRLDDHLACELAAVQAAASKIVPE